MRRVLPPLLVVLVVVSLGASTVWAADALPAGNDRSPVGTIATMLTTITGIAISPLLGTGAYGAYLWMSADNSAAREGLPWFAQLSFWLPALLIVAVCAAKDAFGAVVPPGLKKPLDVLETIENKASGLVAAGAVVPLTMSTFSKMITGSVADGGGMVPTGLAMLPLGAIDLSWLLNLLTVPFGVAMFAIVWMASHAINVLILLSPWGAIDAALKSARTGLLGVITLTATMNPWISAGLSIVVLIVAYFVAGWAFRLTVFGTIFSWDFLTLRRLRFRPQPNANRMFAGGNLAGVPARTYGRLVASESGKCEFVFRPWLVLPPKQVTLEADRANLAVGQGLFFSSITHADTETVFLLPPRYRGHEEAIAASYRLGGGVRPAGLRKAWSVMRDLFGGSAARTQVV